MPFRIPPGFSLATISVDCRFEDSALKALFKSLTESAEAKSARQDYWTNRYDYYNFLLSDLRKAAITRYRIDNYIELKLNSFGSSKRHKHAGDSRSTAIRTFADIPEIPVELLLLFSDGRRVRELLIEEAAHD